MDRGDLPAGGFALHRPAGPVRPDFLGSNAMALVVAAVALAVLALYVLVLQHAVARGPLLANAEPRSARPSVSCEPPARAGPSCGSPDGRSPTGGNQTAMR